MSQASANYPIYQSLSEFPLIFRDLSVFTDYAKIPFLWFSVPIFFPWFLFNFLF